MADKVTQYVGARYVPKFADPVEWQSNTSYEALTIVTYNKSSYTSKIPVPATVGNPAENGTYWVLTGNYNSQVEQYRQETEEVKNSQSTLNSKIEQEISDRSALIYNNNGKADVPLGLSVEGKLSANDGAEISGMLKYGTLETHNGLESVPMTDASGNTYYLPTTSAINGVIICEEENTDITDQINAIFASGRNVILDGKRYKAKPFTIPNWHSLIGNGSFLEMLESDEDYAITFSTSVTGNYDSCESRIAVMEDLKILCGNDYSRYFNGVRIYGGAGVILRNVDVRFPKSVGFKLGMEHTPTSIFMDDCFVAGGYYGDVTGFEIVGTDNHLFRCATLFTKTGIHVTGGGGGTYLTECHPLAGYISTDSFADSVGYLIEDYTIIENCYADNFKTGVYLKANSEINGLFAHWYEDSTIDRTVIRQANSLMSVFIDRVVTDNSGYETVYAIDEKADWNEVSLTYANFKLSPAAKWNVNDLCYVADFVHGPVGKAAGGFGDDNYTVICALNNHGTDSQCWLNLFAKQFTLLGFGIKAWSESSWVLGGKGTLSSCYSNLKIRVSLVISNGIYYLIYKALEGFDDNSSLLIEGHGQSCVLVPRDYKFDSYKEIQGIDLTVVS